MAKDRNKQHKYEAMKNRMERQKAAAIDDLSAYEEFKATLLPKLRRAIQEGKTPDEVMKLVQAVAAARIATIAAFDPDNKTALTAARDLLDRTQGKAKETKQITHAMADAKDEDIDAVLLTALQDEVESDD